MRHERSERLLRLCLMISGSHEGISLARIMEEFSVSRRTAERMRDAALRLLPDAVERMDENGLKRWRAAEAPRGFLAVSAEDIADLQAAADVMEVANRHAQAGNLRALANKLMARQPPAWRRRVEPDLELLMEGEGIVHRAGPVVRVEPEVLRSLRQAILGSLLIRVVYAGRANPAEREMVLEPYGLLYGARPYLVGRVPGKPDFRHFRLQGLRLVDVTQLPFERDAGFDMVAYRARFFGSFREEPFRNVWRFSPAVADDAAEYRFHPAQLAERDTDGSLIVSFEAGGRLEMAWHLMTWGEYVTVLEPTDFWRHPALAGLARAG